MSDIDIAAEAIRRDADADLNPTTDLERAFARGRVQGLKEALGFVLAARKLSPRAVASGGASCAAGAVSAFASGSYRGARAARTLSMVARGKGVQRAYNVVVGRTVASKLWWR